jgi:type II secretory pathway component GspD/PulD (secretin)
MEGGVAGGGSIQPINTGVKLEVTPKFLDKETIDLEVFAQRIFLEAGLSQVSDTITGTSFASTSKTTLSANLTLRYGETMVLSGLSDQEKESLDDKVPGIGDVPGVQYLFRNQRKTSVKKTVLILLTPRRANLSYEDGKPKDINDYGSRKAIDRLEKSVDWMRPASNLKAFVKHLGKYEFFNHYRKGDMQLEDWAGEGTVDDAITRILEYFYIYYGFEKSDESSL